MSLQEKAKSLHQLLNGDRNIQGIGIREKSEYNFEDYIVIYTKNKFEPGTYPDIHEGVKVYAMYVGKIEIRRAADGGI